MSRRNADLSPYFTNSIFSDYIAINTNHFLGLLQCLKDDFLMTVLQKWLNNTLS
jgi:hypothetical protein